MENTEINAILNELQNVTTERLNDMQGQMDAIETALGRSQFPGGSSSRGNFTMAAKDHATKFFGWVRKGTSEDELRGLEIQATMTTQDDPNGGFIVPSTLSTELDRVAPDSVAMRRISRVIGGLKGDYKRPFSRGGSTAGWVGEIESRAETSTPELALFQPPWGELYALPKVSQSLLDDAAFSVESWLLDELMIIEEEYEGAAFVNGTGVKQPKGFLQYDTVADASWEWGKLGYVAGGHATLLNNADKLFSLQHSLKPAYRRNGIWLMNDTTFETVRKFKDGAGDYIWRPGLSADAPDTLLGKPVEIDDNVADIGADEYPIAFGDFKRGYLIGDHAVGRRLLRDPYTEKPYVKLYQTKKTFGGVINFQAVKLLKISTT